MNMKDFNSQNSVLKEAHLHDVTEIVLSQTLLLQTITLQTMY